MNEALLRPRRYLVLAILPRTVRKFPMSSLPKAFSRRLFISLAFVMLVHLSTPTRESAAGFPFGLLDQTGCIDRCPACDHVCHFEAKRVDVEKEVFDVESKVICIPRVVFPWQKRHTDCRCHSGGDTLCSSCISNGARTRRICVLKTAKQTCPECSYSWSAKKVDCVHFDHPENRKKAQSGDAASH